MLLVVSISPSSKFAGVSLKVNVAVALSPAFIDVLLVVMTSDGLKVSTSSAKGREAQCTAPLVSITRATKLC